MKDYHAGADSEGHDMPDHLCVKERDEETEGDGLGPRC